MIYYDNICRSCDLSPHSNGNYMFFPYYVLQTVLVGVPVIFVVLVIGFLVLMDRMRLTPVVRARNEINNENLTFINHLLTTALVYYDQLNEM